MESSTTLAFKDGNILEHIFLHLPWAGLVNAAEVCKDWRAVVSGDECKKILQLHRKWLDDEGFSTSNPFATDHLHPSQDMKGQGNVNAHRTTSDCEFQGSYSAINLERSCPSFCSVQNVLARAGRYVVKLWRKAAAWISEVGSLPLGKHPGKYRYGQ